MPRSTFTWKRFPPDAPSCSTCKHYRFLRGLPFFGTDKHLCAHPKAVCKISGNLAYALSVRKDSAQNDCTVAGLWWEPKEAGAPPLPGRMPPPPDSL